MNSRVHTIFLSSLALFLYFIILQPRHTQAESAFETADSPPYEAQVLEVVNQARWDNGQLPPLKGETSLNNAAETHSSNMATRNFFAHCDFDTGSTPVSRMQAAGYSGNSWGENIAAGYGTPASVMNGWMNSSGHRGNILSTGYREIGIGYFRQNDDQGNIRSDDDGTCSPTSFNQGPYYNYWTQNFGRRNDVMPVVIDREAYETTTRAVELYMYGSGWASSMRFRNENGSWSGWQTYNENTNWTLSSGNGVKTVAAEISSGSNGSGTVRQASDTIILNEEFTGPVLDVSPNIISFSGYSGNSPTIITHTLTIMNDGDENLTWNLNESPNVSWLSPSASNGTLTPGASTAVTISADFSGLSLGIYQTDLIVDAGSAANSPQTIPVFLIYTDKPPVYLPLLFK